MQLPLRLRLRLLILFVRGGLLLPLLLLPVPLCLRRVPPTRRRLCLRRRRLPGLGLPRRTPATRKTPRSPNWLHRDRGERARLPASARDCWPGKSRTRLRSSASLVSWSLERLAARTPVRTSPTSSTIRSRISTTWMAVPRSHSVARSALAAADCLLLPSSHPAAPPRCLLLRCLGR